MVLDTIWVSPEDSDYIRKDIELMGQSDTESDTRPIREIVRNRGAQRMGRKGGGS